MAPLPKPVDLDEANRLASLGYSNSEIAKSLGVSKVHLWRSGFRKDPLPGPHEIDWSAAQEMLDSGAFMAAVAESFGVSVKTLRRRRRSAGLPPLITSPRFGDRAPAFKRGRYTTKRGYVMVLAADHPNAKASGYVLEHRLVMERALGRLLLPGEVVHHINDVKDDNRIENLELFSNNSEHLSATRKGVIRKT